MLRAPLLLAVVPFLFAAAPVVAQPPIQMWIELHADPLGGSVVEQRIAFEERVAAMDFVLDEADVVDAKVGFLMTGHFAEWCLTMPSPVDVQLMRALDRGGVIGTHSHAQEWDSSFTWAGVSPPLHDDLATCRAQWNDHVGFVDRVIVDLLGFSPVEARTINRVRGGGIPGSFAVRSQLMDEFGFTLHEPGIDQTFYDWYGHYIMNPWRPSASNEFAEDDTASTIMIPGCATLGKAAVHYGVYQDTRLQKMQVYFLLTLLNWLDDALDPTRERVWTFGWSSHPKDYVIPGPVSDQLPSMLDWLDRHFDGARIGGTQAAEFSSFVEIESEFLAWEVRNPGASSFDHPTLGFAPSEYPYLEPAADVLVGTDYQRAMPPVDDVSWHELGDPRRPSGARRVWVLTTGENTMATVDLTAHVGDVLVEVIDPRGGLVGRTRTTNVTVQPRGTILRELGTATSVVTSTAATSLDVVSSSPGDPQVRIRFTLERGRAVALDVLDARGRRVQVLIDETLGRGPHEVTWGGRDERGRRVARGAYFVRLRIEGEAAGRARPVVFLR